MKQPDVRDGMEKKRRQLHSWLKQHWDIAQLQGLPWDNVDDVLTGRDIDIALAWVENQGSIL